MKNVKCKINRKLRSRGPKFSTLGSSTVVTRMLSAKVNRNGGNKNVKCDGKSPAG